MEQDRYITYEIRFRGTFSRRWAFWFDGLSMIKLDNGVTILRGAMRDQSELHGVLERIANLNLQLISVNPVELDDPH